MRPTFSGPGQSTGKNYKPKLDPGKSMPSSASGSPADFYSRSQKDVIDEVPKGTNLKPTKTVDKSGPQIGADVKVKKVDRQPFLNEVKSDHELHHVDNVDDRSAPHTEGASLKKNEHGALLAEVKQKGGAEDD